ncbi:hypothetical protein DM860_014980 [Cuscuta australis]|uniref:Ubiquitin-like protease family profile domain-containing protein n=1 Tax=Cuscuta australis TaxID=267555 RepID=A0A328DID9_9ASTE|nr:hypothetical protein DM860_014980 [Cuscuta australis]
MVADIPSFSLGFTQDREWQASGDQHVVDVGNCSNSPFTPVVGVSNVNKQLANDSSEPRGCADPETNLHIVGGAAFGRGSATEEIGRDDPSIVCVSFEYCILTLMNECNDSGYMHREEIVFKKGKFWFSREDICSLDIMRHISKKVLDAWCVILNLREKYRSNTSPLWLFAKTLNCVENGGHEDNSLETKRMMFKDAMKAAWDDAEDTFNWGKLEVFFFPIMQTNWCYVLCVDLKGRRCDILDSSSQEGGEIWRNAIPRDQQGFINKAAYIRELDPKRIGLPWRDAKQVYDYGVATMRHMETYMGEGAKGWDYGLSNLNHKPLLVLRKKYCAAILLHKVNEMMEMLANESFKKDKVVKGTNLE